MRVTFPRLADHQRGYCVVERDDGVVYSMGSSTTMGSELPHDIRHLIVERELRISDGIWGTIAAGTVYTSMSHPRGRRPPPAADRSAQLKRGQRDRVMRAELLASLVEAVAVLDDPSSDEIGRLTSAKLSVVPGDVIAVPPPAALAAAARAMQVEAARWARLRVGENLMYDWRPVGPVASRALRAVPRQRDGGVGRRSPHRR
jgi:hypothetical protein